MINEPKPCPFHEEPIIPDTLTGLDKGNGNPGSGGWWATVECPECCSRFSETECTTEKGALELAINEWNTRYTQECYIILKPSGSDHCGSWHFLCSKCGCPIGVNEVYRGSDGVPIPVSRANFCSNCGSKVMETIAMPAMGECDD